MSFMDRLKSMFGGGSADAGDARAGHDHAGHDHPADDFAAEPLQPPADPVGMSTSEPQPSEPQPAAEEDDRPA